MKLKEVSFNMMRINTNCKEMGIDAIVLNSNVNTNTNIMDTNIIKINTIFI